MLRASRILGDLYGHKYFIFGTRCIYSGRAPSYLPKTNFENAANTETKKVGYGDKEICLLQPIDVRTPLPGNMGVPPLEMFYTMKIQNLPKTIGDQWQSFVSLPEERYQDLLTQLASVAVEKALSASSKLALNGYNCPQLLKKDFMDLFPNRDLSHEALTVITFCQKTQNDMSMWSETGEQEREELEQGFITAAQAICNHLKGSGYWADFIHPSSGKPHLGPLTNATMFETDLRYRNFGFIIEDLGCCRIISHHLWGTRIFVGALFTNAALESLEVGAILDKETDEILRSNKEYF